MRYYYTDPLAAAWMAKHFEMKLGWYNHGRWCKHSSIEDMVCHPLSMYYIHPESMPLLEPKDGDKLYGPCGGELFSVESYPWPEVDQHISIDFAQTLIVESGFRTIQRDGKPFFWPEIENG